MNGSQAQADTEAGQTESVSHAITSSSQTGRHAQPVLQPPWPLQAFWPLQPFLSVLQPP
jgi:hypothetical protein